MTADMHSLSCVTYDFVIQYWSGSKVLSLLLSCFTKIRIMILSIVCPSVRPSLRHALLLLAPQRDKWHLNNNNIEFYWSHFVHLSLNSTCIYLDLKSTYDQNYMLYKKIVRSDKILFGLTKFRILSDRCLTKLLSISTALGVDKNFNLGHNFQTRSDRPFTFHMCIPCDKTFHTVP